MVESNPHHGGTQAYDVWHQGWLEGQAELAQGLGDGPERGRRRRKPAMPVEA
jgi:hypothetical protein